MEYRQITDDYAVSGQITPDDVAAIKAAGFRSIICNRPDDEQPGQPSADGDRPRSQAAGLAFPAHPVHQRPDAPADDVEDRPRRWTRFPVRSSPIAAPARARTNLYALIQAARAEGKR